MTVIFKTVYLLKYAHFLSARFWPNLSNRYDFFRAFVLHIRTSGLLACLCNCKKCCQTLSSYNLKYNITLIEDQTNALSFYRSQNILCWSNFFVPDKKCIYILWQSQTFCARQIDHLHSVKLVFVPAQKFLKRH